MCVSIEWNVTEPGGSAHGIGTSTVHRGSRGSRDELGLGVVGLIIEMRPNYF